MTEKEQNMLNLAKELIDINTNLNAALTGSLLFEFMGIDKRNEAKDIDIIVDCLCEEPNQEGFPILPVGFKLVDIDGRRSAVDSMLFENSDGMIIDFLYSEEDRKSINGMQCGQLEPILSAKYHYSKNDKSEETRNKHLLDLEYLKHWNPELKPIIEEIQKEPTLDLW